MWNKSTPKGLCPSLMAKISLSSKPFFSAFSKRYAFSYLEIIPRCVSDIQVVFKIDPVQEIVRSYQKYQKFFKK